MKKFFNAVLLIYLCFDSIIDLKLTQKMKTRKCLFKSFLIVFTVLSFYAEVNLQSQASYSPYVEYIISTTNLDSICRYSRELTGDTMTYIGGLPYLIYSRVYSSPANDKAADYIMERFNSWGLPARFQQYSSIGRNVIATKTGVKYPNQQYIVCGHYDNYSNEQADTTFGADDNASGVCGILEAARILRNYSLDYTVIFIAFDEEERWMFGSYAYVDSAFARGDSIRGVINLDMIAFDSDNDNKLTVATDTNSFDFAEILFSCCQIYQPQLVPVMQYNMASDHLPFWEKGYVASMLIEDMGDFNIYYHQLGDNYEHINKLYMHSIIKAAIAALVIVSEDLTIDINHQPLSSTLDTSAREVNTVIKSNHPIAHLSNQPRLYYKTYATGFSYVNAFYVNQDTFKFMIPGFSKGTTVEYYIAAQDSAATIVTSVPSGCRGMNPPGTIPPTSFYSYHILDHFSVCSSSLPKDLPPRGIVFDSIFVPFTKMLMDIDVSVSINHQNDTDLYIMLNRSGFAQTNMSIRNGGSGDNYVNTVFDDEADTLITNGTPPFTGHYRPENLLDKYDNTPTPGYWMLKILNMSENITGQLVDWCVNISYYDPIGIAGNQIPVKFSLAQNYPNPFNATTKIRYEIPKQGIVKLVVYDILGREISVLVNREHRPGKYEAVWDANNYSSGVYFYRISYEDIALSRRMVLIK